MHNLHTRTLVLALAFAVSAPLAFEVYRNPEGVADLGASIVQARENAIQSRAAVRRKDRQFWQAIELYQNRVRDGEEGLVPPRINDLEAIQWYLEGRTTQVVVEEEVQADTEDDVQEAEHAAALVQLMQTDLSMKDRHLLRWYIRAHNCPVSLTDYLPGFYELCLSLVKDAPPRKTQIGILNERIQLRKTSVFEQPTLRDRLRMMEEAYDRSNRRTDTTGPGRPTTIPYQAQ